MICAGDIVGYGPFPSETCAYLEDMKISCISGNYDVKVLSVIKEGESAVDDLQKKKRKLVIWTAKNMKKSAQRFLESLPTKLERELPGARRLLVVHGSPAGTDDDIYPSITAKGLKSKMDDAEANVLICGHTHIPFVKRLGGSLIVNCGSVGQPVDGDPDPSYALVHIDEESARGYIVRFSYDVSQITKAVDEIPELSGLQDDFVQGTKRRFLQ